MGKSGGKAKKKLQTPLARVADNKRTGDPGLALDGGAGGVRHEPARLRVDPLTEELHRFDGQTGLFLGL
ncbi:hypothetical protein KBZ21_40805, partial [Streptomyces sp. A73]|nr:hypothetical protein [Streptomyces sp. A73]